jgi:hypothetical protein
MTISQQSGVSPEAAHRTIRKTVFLKGGQTINIKIIPLEKANVVGKLADAEIHFEDVPLAGLKLAGFGIWKGNRGAQGCRVSFPPRQYAVNGEKRSFVLLRPITDIAAIHEVRRLILEAYAQGNTHS